MLCILQEAFTGKKFIKKVNIHPHQHFVNE